MAFKSVLIFSIGVHLLGVSTSRQKKLSNLRMTKKGASLVRSLRVVKHLVFARARKVIKSKENITCNRLSCSSIRKGWTQV